MKKPIVACLVFIVLLMLTATASAQIYKYIDENGQKRWTDDLSQVPREQRETAEKFQDAGDISQEATTNQANSETIETPETDQTDGNVELTRESLTKEKSELENQYQLLMEERKQIEQMKSKKGDATQRAEVNEKISAYNEKIKEYETQLTAYKSKVDAYNNKLITPKETPTQ